ncbi:MAG: PQQ-binding-like beta-propeller repeat protein [Candidatus Acidiferrales bacterium]
MNARNEIVSGAKERTDACEQDRRERLPYAIAIAALLLIFSMARTARAQQYNNRSIATFTSQQAAQGRQAYAASCAGCHGQNLNGGEFASALAGATFTQNWGGKSADTLFSYVCTKMPPDKAGSLSANNCAQLVAFILERNGVQPAATPLPVDVKALEKMSIPRGATQRSAPMMPLSPLAPPIPVVKLPDPLATIRPVTDTLLDNPPASEWLLWRRTYDDKGFSPLKQINTSNVRDMRVLWAWSLPNGPDEMTPLEHDGVLFIDSYGDHVQALNAATGDLLWEYDRHLPNDVRQKNKRNMAIYGDRLYVPTSDDHMVALDVKTGDVVWDQPLADYTKGWQITGGPLVAKGKVMQGIAGQAPGGCWIVALDAETGKPAWKFYTIARPGQFGGNSWNGLPVDKRSGASVWTAGSYDPALNLAYFGTGQTYDTGPMLRLVHEPGVTNDGLYEDTTLAIDPDTGKLVWHFQHIQNDQWDLDWAFEQQLIDLPVNGTTRKLVVTSGKMGIYEGMNAATGKFIFAKDLGLQNVVASINPKTGKATINPEVVLGDGKPHLICPHPGGGRNWLATSYDTETKILYVPMVESCMDLIPAPKGERGNLTSGYDWFVRPRPGSDGKYGRVEAFNLETKKPVWIDRQRAPQSTCILATAGGLVFAGALDRNLKAYDAATGKTMWHVRLNDVPSSCPISYGVGGRQYVAVVVGGGGPQTATFPVLVPEIQNPPGHGAEIWVFALPEKSEAEAHDSQ